MTHMARVRDPYNASPVVVWLGGAAAAFMIAVGGMLLTPMGADAQETIYKPSELTEAPRFANQQRAVRKITESYPSDLRDAGVTGRVQVQFVVRSDGSVDPASVQVLAASVQALGDAAGEVIKEIRFEPGKADGSNVSTRVVFPIQYGG